MKLGNFGTGAEKKKKQNETKQKSKSVTVLTLISGSFVCEPDAMISIRALEGIVLLGTELI